MFNPGEHIISHLIHRLQKWKGQAAMVQPAISLPLVSVFIKRGNINLLRHLCSIYSFLTKHGIQGFGNNDDRHDQTIW